MEVILDGNGIFIIILMALISCTLPIAVMAWFMIRKRNATLNTNWTEGNPESFTSPDANDQNPLSSQVAKLDKKKPVIGCFFLIACLLCIILLPCNFIFTLGAGMSGDFGETITILIIIAFCAHIAATIVLGVVGVVFWLLSVMEKHLGVQQDG